MLGQGLSPDTRRPPFEEKTKGRGASRAQNWLLPKCPRSTRDPAFSLMTQVNCHKFSELSKTLISISACSTLETHSRPDPLSATRADLSSFLNPHQAHSFQAHFPHPN